MIHVTERGIRDTYSVDYASSLAVAPWRNLAQLIETEDPNGETTVRVAGLRGMEQRQSMPNWVETIPTMPYKWFTLPWNDGFTVTRDEYKYDKHQQVNDKVTQLAENAAFHPGELCMTVISNLMNDFGTGDLKDPFIDSIAFIGESHPIADDAGTETTQSNYFDAEDVSALETTAAIPTASEWEDILIGLAVQAQQMKGDNGLRMHQHIRDWVVCLPPTLIPSAYKATRKAMIASGETNTLGQKDSAAYTFETMMIPDATGGDNILMVPKGRKPIGLQVLEWPNSKNLKMLGEGTDHFVKEENIPVWINGRYQATHLYWENCIGAVRSTAT